MRAMKNPSRTHGCAARPAARIALCAFISLSALALASAQSDEELFGEETVAEAAPVADAPQNAFLKYDQVKIGGSISSSIGASAVWDDPWGGEAGLFDPDKTKFSPALSGSLTLMAKPVEDFGVNADLRFSYPFSTTSSVLSGATYHAADAFHSTPYIVPSTTKVTTQNITVRSFYSKWSLKDAIFMSFGKQPIAWGVSKGFFQPADDIFALTSVDFADTAAEREGPLAFKAMYSVPLTMTSFYLYAGLPPSTDSSGSASYDFEDVRYAAKAEFNFGDTEAAVAAFYGWNDHPRALVMATTGIGSFNLYGEGVLKYGSERYFISKNGSAAMSAWSGTQKSDQFFFSGTLGGYYQDSNNNLSISAQVYYNGESQSDITASEAYTYYLAHSSEADRMRLSAFYAGASVSKSKLLTDDLSASFYAVANLSDLSGMVVPSLSYSFSDYSSVKLSATFTFGSTGGEFLISGPDMSYIATHSNFTTYPYTLVFDENPGVALSLTFSLGTGSF